jgi:hypothetical protein
MARTGGFFRSILVWTYERGTLQYDVICVLIIAFVLLVPRGCFTGRKHANTSGAAASKLHSPAQTAPVPPPNPAK